MKFKKPEVLKAIRAIVKIRSQNENDSSDGKKKGSSLADITKKLVQRKSEIINENDK